MVIGTDMSTIERVAAHVDAARALVARATQRAADDTLAPPKYLLAGWRRDRTAGKVDDLLGAAATELDGAAQAVPTGSPGHAAIGDALQAVTDARSHRLPGDAGRDGAMLGALDALHELVDLPTVLAAPGDATAAADISSRLRANAARDLLLGTAHLTEPAVLDAFATGGEHVALATPRAERAVALLDGHVAPAPPSPITHLERDAVLKTPNGFFVSNRAQSPWESLLDLRAALSAGAAPSGVPAGDWSRTSAVAVGVTADRLARRLDEPGALVAAAPAPADGLDATLADRAAVHLLDAQNAARGRSQFLVGAERSTTTTRLRSDLLLARSAAQATGDTKLVAALDGATAPVHDQRRYSKAAVETLDGAVGDIADHARDTALVPRVLASVAPSGDEAVDAIRRAEALTRAAGDVSATAGATHNSNGGIDTARLLLLRGQQQLRAAVPELRDVDPMVTSAVEDSLARMQHLDERMAKVQASNQSSEWAYPPQAEFGQTMSSLSVLGTMAEQLRGMESI